MQNTQSYELICGEQVLRPSDLEREVAYAGFTFSSEAVCAAVGSPSGTWRQALDVWGCSTCIGQEIKTRRGAFWNKTYPN